jgi:hypothetical protein
MLRTLKGGPSDLIESQPPPRTPGNKFDSLVDGGIDHCRRIPAEGFAQTLLDSLAHRPKARGAILVAPQEARLLNP